MERGRRPRTTHAIQKAAAQVVFAASVAFATLPAWAAWAYETTSDRMGRGNSQIASVESKDPVALEWPHNKRQRATLYLRRHSTGRLDAFLVVDPSQFDCSISGCYVTLKFDAGKATRWGASPADNGRSEAIFFNDPGTLLQRLRKSKVLLLEAAFFRQGRHIMEFSVGGLTFK